mmetsp:Transcript_46776/g.111355  ORF Transcript_46776/g.111355 Transcript_46776/m.111355 type:complete len:228 (-) Transcript_46776:1710-2393(-)
MVLAADLRATLPLVIPADASSSALLIPSTFFFCMRSFSPPAFMISSWIFLHTPSAASDFFSALAAACSLARRAAWSSLTLLLSAGAARASSSNTLRLARVSSSSLASASRSISILSAAERVCASSRTHPSIARSSAWRRLRVSVSSSETLARVFSSLSICSGDTPSSETTFDDIPPRDTLLPPPDMVPEVSMTLPSSVTTRERCEPPYACFIAISRFSATRVSRSAK